MRNSLAPFDTNRFSKPIKDDKKIKLSRLLSKFIIKNHKVAVITPPLHEPNSINPDSVHRRAYHAYPPLGQLYICASVDDVDSWQSVPFDLNLMMLRNAAEDKKYNLESLVNCIPDDFDAYLVGCMFSTSADVYKKVCHLLKKRGKLCVVGGVYATGCYEDFLIDDCADVVIKFEGEYQVANFLRFWDGLNVDLKNISFFINEKIFSFDEEHEGVITPDVTPQLEKIKDTIPDYSKYGSFGHFARALGGNRRIATVLGTRGCRGFCTFCSVRNFMGKGVRVFDEELMLKTIKYLYNECGVRYIDWLDDDMLADRDKAISLFNKIAELNYDLVFTVTNAVLARNINEELIDAIGRAGFIQIGFGVETGNPEMRKRVRKTTNLKNLKETIELFKTKFPDIFIHCNFMIGFPGETAGQILDTFNYARSLEVDWCQVAIVQALPNTPMYDEFVALDDPRVSKSQKYSPASEAKRKGASIDDIGLSVVDVFSMPHNHAPSLDELNGMWYPLNTRLNFLENKNLSSTGRLWKLRNFNSALLESYPDDPIMLLLASKCCGLDGDADGMLKYRRLAVNRVNMSRFWREFLGFMKRYDRYDIINILEEEL